MDMASALLQGRKQSPHLPKLPALQDLYDAQIVPRRGEVIMVVGREGSGKSTFALWLAEQMQLETLYFCADMSQLEAAQKVASQRMGLSYGEVENMVADDGPEFRAILRNLELSKIDMEFGHITWEDVQIALDDWAETLNRHPEVIVFDNLLDIEDCYADYTLQEEVMQFLKRLAQETGSTVIVMHHTTKPDRATDWSKPPSTSEIKGNLGRVPQMILSVALDAEAGLMNVSCLKQRMGPCDKSGKTHAQLRAALEYNRFERNGAVAEFVPMGPGLEDEPEIGEDTEDDVTIAPVETEWDRFIREFMHGNSPAQGQHETDRAGEDDRPEFGEDQGIQRTGDPRVAEQVDETRVHQSVPALCDFDLLYDSPEVALHEYRRALEAGTQVPIEAGWGRSRQASAFRGRRATDGGPDP